MATRIAYFINEYPKISHSFIRREILALENQGFDVERLALRGWKNELVDEADFRERARTRYVLGGGMPALVWPLVRAFLTAPMRFLSALMLAIRMASPGAERPLPYHLGYLAEACRMLPWLKSSGATHLHAHFGTNSAEIAMLAHVLGGPPYSFTIHGPMEFDTRGIGEKVRRSAFVVTVSSFGRGYLFRWIEHACWPKVRVIHTGLERTFHEGATTPVPAAPQLVCVGRLCDEKGHLLLVEAAAQLAAKEIPFELVLAGDGELRDQVESAIEKFALKERVRITGWVTNNQVRDEILAARGLILPSFSEGLPVVIMEAMALRRPVLSTYVGGIPELVRPGENGWLVPAGDVDQLAAAMEEMLAKPVDELQKMGDAGYQLIMERHSVDVEATKLAKLFRESAGTVNCK